MLLEEELTLVKRAQDGDQTAVGLLWDDITPKLYGYLVNTMKNQQVAEDVLQDTWLKAIKAIDTFRPRGVRFSAWLFAIARNECRQHWRKSHREVSLEEKEDIPLIMSNDHLIDKVTLESALANLPTDDQEILCLRYISDLSFKEIAHVLETTTVSARVRTHRALRRANILLNQS